MHEGRFARFQGVEGVLSLSVLSQLYTALPVVCVFIGFSLLSSVHAVPAIQSPWDIHVSEPAGAREVNLGETAARSLS